MKRAFEQCNAGSLRASVIENRSTNLNYEVQWNTVVQK